MVSVHDTDLSLDWKVGTSVFIENKEWIVAEVLNGIIKLLRESIDGTCRTLDVTKIELQKLVKESQHIFEN